MGGYSDQRFASIGLGPGNDVAGAVDLGVAAQRAELLGHPLGALLFEEGGGGNSAQREVLFVNPELLAGEEGQALPDAARFGQRADAVRFDPSAHLLPSVAEAAGRRREASAERRRAHGGRESSIAPSASWGVGAAHGRAGSGRGQWTSALRNRMPRS